MTLAGGVADLVRVIETAAAVDDGIARLQVKMGDEFYENQHRIIDHLHVSGHLRPDLTVGEATDILWTINSTRTYLMLVQDRGWTPERYERWLAVALRRELLP